MKKLECPNCQTQIGLLQFMISLMYTRCRKCDEKFQLKNLYGALLVIFPFIACFTLAIYNVPFTNILLVVILFAIVLIVALYYLFRIFGIGLKEKE